MSIQIRLCDFFVADVLIADVRSERDDAVIAEMVSAMSAPLCLDEAAAAEITRQVIARERRGSSVLGRGFALPHLKHPAVQRIAFTVARSSRGVSFAALDGKPVHMFALTLAPKNPPPEYVAVLNRLLAFFENKQSRRFLLTAEQGEPVGALKNPCEQHTRYGRRDHEQSRRLHLSLLPRSAFRATMRARPAVEAPVLIRSGLCSTGLMPALSGRASWSPSTLSRCDLTGFARARSPAREPDPQRQSRPLST